MLKSLDPDVIVSVHPMINQFLARALEEANLRHRVKVVTVVTDPNNTFWHGWANPDADLTIVANSLSKDQLVNWGVPEEKIRVVGMPVHPDFVKAPAINKEQFRKDLGLQKNRFTVCLNAGWAGGGNMMAMHRALAQVKRPIQVIFVCGHNRRLYEKAKRAARKSNVLTAVLPFHDRMADLMDATDLMVTKAGGLTTFEAIAKRLPIAIDLISPAMPQELGTVDILVEQKLAYPIRDAQEIVPLIENLETIDERHTLQLPSVFNLNSVDAVYNIAKILIDLCDNKNHRQLVKAPERTLEISG
jgi:UDP-N-acetylglucosamine:LPS N-acetylglucosamine transferase